MATGDITQAEILANGWQTKLTIEGLGTGGAYSFGYDSEYLPGDSAMVYNLTSPAYSGGVLTTRVRALWTGLDINTGALRNPYPLEDTPQETVVGSDVEIILPLSDYVFSGDTGITVDIAAGFYTEGGTPSNAISGLSVTNSATETYPIVVGNWFITGRDLVRDNFVIEFGAFHRYGVDQVDFEITDGVNTVNYSVTDMTVSEKLDYNKVLAYIKTVDVSTLNDGLLTVKAVAYPYYGDVGAKLDTGDGVNTWPTPLYTNRQYRLDTGNTHGYCVVDNVNGDDSTGTIYNTQPLAEAGNSYLTVATALTALQTYHNTYAGHNDAGGGTILIPEGTLAFDTENGGTTTEWVTFTRMSTATKALAKIQGTSTNADHPTYCRFYDLTWEDSNFFRGGGDDMFLCDSVILNCTNTTVNYYNSPYIAFLFCSGVFESSFRIFSSYLSQFALVRGNSFDNKVSCDGYTIVGNHNVSLSERSGTVAVRQTGLIYGFNTVNHDEIGLQLGLGISDNVDNIAIIQNLVIRYGSQIAPLWQISADGTTTTTRNVLIWNNTLTGARNNFAYNDITSGGPYSQDLWSEMGNIWSNYNNKTDIFGANTDGVGGWPVSYHVGASGNFYRSSAQDDWFGDFQGLSMIKGTTATPLEPLYVDDQSADGSDTSGGDYQLQGLSEARGLGLEEVLPYDLDGVLRTTYDAGVYQYIETSTDIECDPIVLPRLIVGSSIVGAFIECDALSLGKIELSELEVQGVIYCDGLTLPYMVLPFAIVIGEIECNNLVLNNAILGVAIAGEITPISPDVISVPGEITMSWTITGELV